MAFRVGIEKEFRTVEAQPVLRDRMDRKRETALDCPGRTSGKNTCQT